MPFDDEQKAELTALIAEAVGEATKTIGQTTKAQLTSALKELDVAGTVNAAVESRVKEFAPSDEQTQDKPTDKGDAKFVAKLKEMQRQIEEERGARQAAEASKEEERMLNAFRSALTDAGVERSQHAIALLHNAQNRIKTEDGVAGIEFQRDGYKEVVPFEKAVPEWLKSNDGKAFLPPTNVQGTGSGRGDKRAARGDVTSADSVVNSLLGQFFG